MADDTIENGATEVEVDDYDQKLKFINPIAQPLASKKLVKRVFKCIKKGNLIKKLLII